MNRRAHLPAPAARIRRQEARVIPQLEALEDRTLLSAPVPVTAAYEPDQILVQFRPGAAPIIHVPGATLGQALDVVPGLYDVELSGLSVSDAVAVFQADPQVLSAQPDYLLTAQGSPNDPLFGNQWGLLNTGQSGGTAGVDVGATQAWTVTTGSPGVVVSLIDTGVDYNHIDLYQNIWINQAEIPDSWLTKSSASASTYTKTVYKSQIQTAAPGVITFADLNNPVNKGLVWDNNNDGRIDAADLLRPTAQGGWDSGSTKDGDTAHPDDYFGWNFAANTNNPFDDNGHGTNVAGIIGAAGNNGVGVAGLDWNVQLQAVKAFDSNGFASDSTLIAAIGYSIQHGAKISNNSWGEPAGSSGLQSAVASARAAGQIFVVAAGNGGAATPQYPAMYTTQFDNAVSVAAVDHSGNLWSNSDYGASTVTLAAPGVNILSTAPNWGFSYYTGTSQATAFVAATLALVWGQHPTWTYQQVINQVTSTTTPLASLKGKTITGGMVNAAAALGASANGGGQHKPPPAPNVVSAAFSGPDAHSLNKVLVTFDQFIDATTFNSSTVHLTNPSGQVVPLTAAKLAPGSDGHQFEIDFNTQTAPGSYALSITSGVHSTLGAALAPYTASAVVTPGQYVFTSTTTSPIPDPGTVVSTITIGQDITIGSLQVTLNVTHPYDGDLYIVLQAPDGTSVLLVNQRGGAGHNFVNTIFADSASTPIRLGAAPFTGTFKPETALSALAGKDARGVWKLYVSDMSPGDAGVLNGWSLTITPRAAGAAGVSGNAVGVSTISESPAYPAAPVPVPHLTAAADAVFIAAGTQPSAIFQTSSWRSVVGASHWRDKDDGTGGLP